MKIEDACPTCGALCEVDLDADEEEYVAIDVAARATSEQSNLTVWSGSMPESNGKSNFTAILHRGDLSKGHTIDRSEYPDRVRYEADRVRWLIGEIDKEPWILDYDADKHSGYVSPNRALKSQQDAAIESKQAQQITYEMMAEKLSDDGYSRQADSIRKIIAAIESQRSGDGS